MDHFLAKRLRLDRHVVERPGHGVDDRGMRARHVDDDGRLHRFATVQGDAAYPALIGEDAHDLAPEGELGALRLRRTLQVVGGKLRIGDVAAVRPEDGALDLASARLAEALVVHGPGRSEAAKIEERDPRPDRRPVPFLARDPELVRESEVLFEPAVVLGLHHHATGVDEPREPALVVRPEVVRPFLPVVIGLPGERDPVEGRVVDPDDRARVRGRPVARGGVPVHAQGAVSELRELEGGRGADDPRPDDDGVVLITHGSSSSLARAGPGRIRFCEIRSLPRRTARRHGGSVESLARDLAAQNLPRVPGREPVRIERVGVPAGAVPPAGRPR